MPYLPGAGIARPWSRVGPVFKGNGRSGILPWTGARAGRDARDTAGFETCGTLIRDGARTPALIQRLFIWTGQLVAGR